MDLFKAVNIEFVGLCLAGLVLIQLVFEVRKHRRGSTETPPRIVCLDGELGGFWPEIEGSNEGRSAPGSEAAGAK